MQSNMQEGAARGTRLDTLQDKSDRLHDASVNFTKHSNTLRKKMWAKNMRMKLIIGGGIALIIIIIIIGSVRKSIRVVTQTAGTDPLSFQSEVRSRPDGVLRVSPTFSFLELELGLALKAGSYGSMI